MKKTKLIEILVKDIAENGDDELGYNLLFDNEIVKLRYFITIGETEKDTFSCTRGGFDKKLLKKVRDTFKKDLK